MEIIVATIRKRQWQSGGETKTTWVADYFDQSRKRHLKTFQRKRDAEAWLAETQIEVRRGTHTPVRQSPTVAEAGEAWIEQAEADGLERSTVRQYRQHLGLHILPFLGAVKLSELTPFAVQDFRNRLIREGRSATLAKKAVVSLGAIVAHAQSTGRVARNVVREQSRENARRQRGHERRHTRRLEVGVDVPSKDEIKAMLDHVPTAWRPLLVTAIFTGLRASELRGLCWADVDLDAETLTVRQRADRWGEIGSPKSDAGKRTVPLAPMVVNALREWKLRCPASPAGLVFPTRSGAVQDLTNVTRAALGATQKAAGICDDPRRPKYGMHSLRHAAASLLIEQGFSPKRVQALLGHSSIQVTFDTYGHLFPAPEEDREAMAQLQARLVG